MGSATLRGGSISGNKAAGVAVYGGKVTVAEPQGGKPQIVSKDNKGGRAEQVKQRRMARGANSEEQLWRLRLAKARARRSSTDSPTHQPLRCRGRS